MYVAIVAFVVLGAILCLALIMAAGRADRKLEDMQGVCPGCGIKGLHRTMFRRYFPDGTWELVEKEVCDSCRHQRERVLEVGKAKVG